MANQTIKEIERSFKDEWLVIRVTAMDGEGYATRGEVLSHSPERDRAYEALATYRDEPFLKTSYTGNLPKGRGGDSPFRSFDLNRALIASSFSPMP